MANPEWENYNLEQVVCRVSLSAGCVKVSENDSPKRRLVKFLSVIEEERFKDKDRLDYLERHGYKVLAGLPLREAIDICMEGEK